MRYVWTSRYHKRNIYIWPMYIVDVFFFLPPSKTPLTGEVGRQSGVFALQQVGLGVHLYSFVCLWSMWCIMQSFLRLWVENNIGIYRDSIYMPCQPKRSFEFVCLDSQCHKEFGSKPQIYSNPKPFHKNTKLNKKLNFLASKYFYPSRCEVSLAQ